MMRHVILLTLIIIISFTTAYAEKSMTIDLPKPKETPSIILPKKNESAKEKWEKRLTKPSSDAGSKTAANLTKDINSNKRIIEGTKKNSTIFRANHPALLQKNAINKKTFRFNNGE